MASSPAAKKAVPLHDAVDEAAFSTFLQFKMVHSRDSPHVFVLRSFSSRAVKDYARCQSHEIIRQSSPYSQNLNNHDNFCSIVYFSCLWIRCVTQNQHRLKIVYLPRIRCRLVAHLIHESSLFIQIYKWRSLYCLSLVCLDFFCPAFRFNMSRIQLGLRTE